MQKWNFKTQVYKPYSVEWEVCLFAHDMDLIINCTSCGDKLVYGKSYTSRTIHTEMGLGYPVCHDCYQVEWGEERKAKDIKVD